MQGFRYIVGLFVISAVLLAGFGVPRVLAEGLGCGVPGSTCSKAEVAAHNTVRKCWVIYDGSYYEAAAFVGANPGSVAMLPSAWCGRDATAYINGLKWQGPAAKDALAPYRIGPVQ